MRRVIGFVACTSLLTATLWWVNLGETAETTSGREPRTASSPREALSLGRDHYIRGRFAEAIALLEGAAAAESDLTDVERKTLDDYLARARAKLGPAAQPEVVARGQSPEPKGAAGRRDLRSAPPEGKATGNAQRNEAARKLISDARHKFNAGKIAEASKLAQECQKLGVRSKMFGDSPEKLLEDIQEYQQQEAKWKKDNASNQAKRDRSNYLLKRARQMAEEGDGANAERLVRDAEQIKVQRVLTDLKPEHIRQMLARKPASARPSSGVVQAEAVAAPGKKGVVKHVNADEDSLDLALEDEMPVEEPASRLAAKNPSPVPAKKPVPPKSASTASKQAQAEELLKQAELDLSEGRLDEAREKAQRAQALDVAFDDVMSIDPEFMLAQIERAERSGMLAKKTATKAPEASLMASKRKAASNLTEQARADLEAGNLEGARTKATKAQDMDVAFDLMDSTPEDVNERIAREEDKRYIAKSNAAAPADEGVDVPELDEVAPAMEMPADEIAQLDETPEAPAEMEIADVNVIRPTGLSATELYERGKHAIRARQPQEAYNYFLEAYQSGQRLDPRRTQEIQQYLAQHNPGRARKKIQLTGTRLVDDTVVEEPADEDAPRRIDVVDEQRQISLDKLRTEVRNMIFRAEHLGEKNPEAALELIDKAQASVENSGLNADSTRQLLSAIEKSRQNVEYTGRLNAPKNEMERRNKEVKDIVKNEGAVKVRIEKEFAEKVERFNEMMDQKRFKEAQVLAKQAKTLAPENPVAEVMVLKSRIAAQDAFNQDIREKKANTFTEMLNDVDLAAAEYTADITYPDAKKWKDLTQKRDKYRRADNRTRTKEEERIEKSLGRDISLHFDAEPLAEVVKHLAALAEVNIVVDPAGLEDAGVTPSSMVSINVDGIRLKSALNLLLEPLNLGYTVRDDVLKITSRIKQQGDLVTTTYPVADLVVPIQSFAPPNSLGMTSSGSVADSRPTGGFGNRGQMNVQAMGGYNRPSGQAFAQIDDREGPTPPSNRRPGSGSWGEFGGGGNQADFTELIELITSTVQPDTWDEVGGPGSVREFNTTLSLVIRQTQAVHDEIADLLGQLRRLQDLQVTIEVRFVTVSDRFFERIGIDFDFNVHDNVGDGNIPNTFGQPLPPFGNGTRVVTTTTGTTGTTGGTAGTTGGTAGTTGGTTGTTGGTAGTTGGTAGTAGTTGTTGTSGSGGTAPFTAGPPRDTFNRNSFPRYGSIIGLNQNNSITSDLDIPFRQGSFSAAVPQFGGFTPDAGLSVGLAILSDIETFFLIQAAQGDERTNLLFAPKVTLFNGQQATVQSTRQRPFVTSLIPTVGFFSVGFQPVITVLSEGVTLSVLAVISADRRYVRLSLVPFFSTITDVQSFSFVSGGGVGGGTTGGQGAGGVTQGGGFGGQAAGGATGGFGGGQFGVGGIGGTAGTTGGTAGTTGGTAGTTGGQAGQQGQQAQGGAASGASITVQQPIFEIVSISTTVSVPDGGTVLLGGVKRLREGRRMQGVPILNKIPYISRLFKNTGIGRETESLMMMVTPRIIIQEEEEELLGVDAL